MLLMVVVVVVVVEHIWLDLFLIFMTPRGRRVPNPALSNVSRDYLFIYLFIHLPLYLHIYSSSSSRLRH